MYGTVLMPLHAYITATTTAAVAAVVVAVKHTNTRKLYKTIAARICSGPVLLFILVMNFDYK